MGALTLLVKMRPSTAQQAIIGRELALVFARAAFPSSVLHTPGIAHKVADQLSRVYDPKAQANTDHPALKEAVKVEVEARPRHWYRALNEHSA